MSNVVGGRWIRKILISFTCGALVLVMGGAYPMGGDMEAEWVSWGGSIVGPGEFFTSGVISEIDTQRHTSTFSMSGQDDVVKSRADDGLVLGWIHDSGLCEEGGPGARWSHSTLYEIEFTGTPKASGDSNVPCDIE